MANRIREWRLKRGLSQVQLAEKSGIGQSLISTYERDEGNPEQETLEKLAAALGVRIGDLFPSSSSTTDQSVSLTGVPFLGRIVASPDGKEYFDDDVPKDAIVPFFKNKHNGFFALEVENDSLINAQPEEIYPGDICIFDRNKQPRNGDIVAVHFSRSNKRTVKILYHKSREEVELRSANKFRNYPSIVVEKDDIVSFGVFIGKIKISEELKRQYGLKR